MISNVFFNGIEKPISAGTIWQANDGSNQP